MRDWVLVYGMKMKGLEGFTDVDGAMQEHRHAITGYAFLIDGGAVSRFSKKQEIVTLSTAKSEYVAATHAAKEAIWLHWFIGEVLQPLTNPIPLYSDLQATIALTCDRSYHAHTKHIYIWYYFIWFIIIMGRLILYIALLTTWSPTHLPRHFPTLKCSILLLCLAYNWLEEGVLEYSRSIKLTAESTAEVQISFYGIWVCSYLLPIHHWTWCYIIIVN